MEKKQLKKSFDLKKIKEAKEFLFDNFDICTANYVINFMVIKKVFDEGNVEPNDLDFENTEKAYSFIKAFQEIIVEKATELGCRFISIIKEDESKQPLLKEELEFLQSVMLFELTTMEEIKLSYIEYEQVPLNFEELSYKALLKKPPEEKTASGFLNFFKRFTPF